ncbi:MAG: hypothetical protein KC418_16715, partial [Anaerolineales bacterium]|nr:hypothetical protein [Anaerolineales bacterium]
TIAPPASPQPAPAPRFAPLPALRPVPGAVYAASPLPPAPRPNFAPTAMPASPPPPPATYPSPAPPQPEHLAPPPPPAPRTATAPTARPAYPSRSTPTPPTVAETVPGIYPPLSSSSSFADYAKLSASAAPSVVPTVVSPDYAKLSEEEPSSVPAFATTEAERWPSLLPLEQLDHVPTSAPAERARKQRRRLDEEQLGIMNG